MNKEYIYKDGQALIIDDNFHQKIVDYYDNLDEVLVQENLIEEMKENIKKLEKETSKYKEDSELSRILWILQPFLIFTFGPLLMFPFISNIFGMNTIVNTALLGTMNSGIFFGLISAFMMSIPGILLSLFSYLKEKKIKQEQIAKETQLEYLKREIVEQKEILEKLKSDKTNSKQMEEFYMLKVDNKEMLEKLKNFLMFYYNLGYNQKKYFKYYQQGKLDNYLAKYTNNEGISFANQYFEEKNKTLVKIKNKNKK